MATPASSGSAAFLLLFRNAGADTHAHLTDAEKAVLAKKWNDWAERLFAQGKTAHAAPLGLAGRVVTGTGAAARVIDGPYAEGKEIVGGYFFLTVATIDEATEIAKECPGLALGLVVEVRPVAAFSPVLTEVKARAAGK